MPDNREILVRSAKDSKNKLHFVCPRGWGRGYEIACTGEKVNWFSIREVRAVHIRCSQCQMLISE